MNPHLNHTKIFLTEAGKWVVQRTAGITSWIAKNRLRKHLSIYISITLIVAILVVFNLPEPAFGTSYTFTQTNWNGGTSASTITHPTNQTGWTNYASSTNLSVVNSGADLQLPQATYYATDTTALTTSGSATGGGFANGTQSNTQISSNAIKLGFAAKAAPWTSLASAPGAIGASSGNVAGSNAAVAVSNEIYVLKGNGFQTFYKYSIGSNSWSTLADTPATLGFGYSIAYPGSGDYIYVFRGGATTFYRYSISGNSWSTMAAFPTSISVGAALAGVNGDVYALQGNGSSNFYKYSVASDSWTALASTTNSQLTNSQLSYPGTGDYIYFARGSSGAMYKYSISGNTWSLLGATNTQTLQFSNAGAVTWAGTNMYYFTDSASTTPMSMYSQTDNTIYSKASLNAPSGNGMGAVYPGSGNYVYFIAGKGLTTIYKYDITQDTVGWTQLTGPGTTFLAGAASAYVSSTSKIYALRGTSATFWEYDIAGNSWTTKSALPASAADGSTLVYTGNDYLYATRGNTINFYRYSISGNSWSLAMTAAPAAINQGASAVWAGGDTIYVSKGLGATTWYKYSISGNAWTTGANIPQGTWANNGAVWTGGDYIYLLRGGGSHHLFRYSISGDSWTTLALAPEYIYSNGGGLYWPGGDIIYVSRGSATNSSQSDIYAYSISGDSWSVVNSAPNYMQTGATFTVGGSNVYVGAVGSQSTLYKLNLSNYNSSGTYTSAVVDLGGTAALARVNYSATTPSNTALTVDMRTGDTATPDGTWSAWSTGLTSGASLATMGSHRYVQYRVNLSTTNSSVTPQLDSLTISYNQYATSGALQSSSYNTTDSGNIIGTVSWTEDTSLPTGASVMISVRTAATSGGLASASWSDFTSTTTNCSKSSGTVTCASSAIPNVLKDSSGDQWFEYKVTLLSNGSATPTLGQVSITYVVNAPPDFDTSFGTGGVQAYQVGTSTDPLFGKVVINYRVRDTDTSTGTTLPGYVAPTFEYNTGSGWNTIASQYLGATDSANKAVNSSSYTTYSATWDAASQLSGSYVSSAQIRVKVDDREAANNTATATSSAFVIDAKAPVVSGINLDASSNQLLIKATDNSAIEYKASNNANLTADGSNSNSGTWQSIADQSATTTVSWTLSGTTTPTAYVIIRDAYGNAIATTTVVAPSGPTHTEIKDISNISIGAYRLFLSWNAYTPASGATFSKYQIYRSTDGNAYSLLTTITDSATNYYTDSGLNGANTYYYKVKVIDTDGDVSPLSTVVSDIPDGQGGSDSVAPAISSVAVASTQPTWAKITWITDELADSVVQYSSTNGDYSSTASSSSFVTSHSVTISNLQPNTTYYFRVKSSDVYGNQASNDNNGVGYTFVTTTGTVITDVALQAATDETATIVWNTTTNSNSYVVYASDVASLISGTNIHEVGSPDLVAATTSNQTKYQHRVTLSGLETHTTYYYYVKSTDGDNNTATDNNGGNYYSFVTTNDVTPPVISGIATPVITSSSVVVIWKTDELADSQIQYGTASGTYTHLTTLDPVSTINHTVTIEGLDPESVYYFVVQSRDAQSNISVSSEQTVTTTSTGETTVVNIINGVGKGPDEIKDAIKPIVSEVSASTTGPFSAQVTFSTNKPTTAFVPYGRSVYENTIGDPELSTHHVVKLNGLQMGATYHYMVKVQDSNGNFAESIDQAFTTNYATEPLNDLVTLKDAARFQDQLENLIQSMLPSLLPPFISDITVASTSDTAATIVWKTNAPTYGTVQYVTDGDYTTSAANPYKQQVAPIEAKTTEHSVTLTNLSPATKYHFRVSSYSLPGVVANSKDNVFATKSSRIRTEVSKVGNSDFEIRWYTTQRTSSVVEYKDQRTGKTSRVEDPTQVSSHIVKVDNINPDTGYSVRAYGYDGSGTLVEGDSVNLRTGKDSTAPSISTVKIDNALLPGRSDRLQTVVSWLTDEPANSKVYYEEGAGTSALTTFVSQAAYTQEHILIIPSLKPSTVYRIKVVSQDESGNTAASAVKTILTPQSTEDVIDVIVKNLQDSFGFLNKLR